MAYKNFHQLSATLNMDFVFTLLMKLCINLFNFNADPYEVKLLRREHFNRWYSLRAYYVAIQLSKIPTMVSRVHVLNSDSL